MAGVTTRTLRYYDEVGLLKPSRIGENGYRYYEHTNLLQLQQIMFYRELDIPLKEIFFFLSRPDYSIANGLLEHRHRLEAKMQRLRELIELIDQTLLTIKGEWSMSDKDYFRGFDEKEYEGEAVQKWGHTDKYRDSKQKWASYTEDKRNEIKAEGGRLTVRMVSGNPDAKPDDPEVQAAVGEYFKYLNKYFYKCDLEFFRLLADMWVEDPRFAANYDRIREGGAVFVKEAVHIYCENELG
jgi:DNA-binding transcriptional MerR regulator